MSLVRWSGCSTILFALAFSATAASDAPARQNVKKSSQQRPAASLGIDIPAAEPVRFFTINQVLAKRDTQRTASPHVQLANATTTTTDTPVVERHLLPSSEPFGMFTFRAPEGQLWVKWRGLEQRMQAEAREIERCKTDRGSCSPQAQHFLRLVDSAQSNDGRARIDTVNRMINAAVRYTSDHAQHGVADVWSAPLETLASGRGDCEDYAIAKYAILRATGVPENDLRLLLVRDRLVRQDHAVLAVRDNGQWLILDNRHLLLVEATGVQHFTPLFAIDHNGVNLFAAPYAARPAPFIESATAPSANERLPASTQGEPQDSWGTALTPYLL